MIADIKPILTKYQTNIYGLSFYPSLEPYFSDDRDACISGDLRVCFEPPLCKMNYTPKVNVTEKSYNKVVEIVKSFSGDIFIVEIGIDRDGPDGFTQAFHRNKSENSMYLGIDIDDKSSLNNKDKHIYTLKTDSRNQDYIRNKIGQNKIDILMIDGWHSVNCAINDWKYVDLLSNDGIVIVHDSNGHPGPLALMEAIDRTKFNVDNLFVNCDDDYGLCVIKRK